MDITIAHQISTLLDQGKDQEADLLVKEIPVDRGALPGEILAQIGRLRLRQFRYDDASQMLLLSLKKGYFAKGIIKAAISRLIELKDANNAIAISAAALATNPEEATTLYLYGTVMSSFHLPELAEPALRKATLGLSDDDGVFRALGNCLLKIRKVQDARISFDKALALAPAKATVRSFLPENIIRNALEEQPNWSWAQYQLGIQTFESRRFGEAEALFSDIVEREARSELHAAACAMQAECVRRVYDKTIAASKITAIIERHGVEGDPWRDLYRGLLSYYAGDIHEAAVRFSHVTPIAIEQLAVSRGVTTFVAEVDSSSSTFKPANFEVYGGDVRETDELIVFAAADGRYTELFLEPFVGSILNSNGNVPIHIHVVNPTNKSKKAIQDICETVPWARISHSSEEISLPAPRPYYAMARFLIAPKLMDHFKKPLLVVDIDAAMIKGVRTAISDFADYDVAAKYNPSNKIEFPWMEIFATFILFMPTGGAKNFLKNLSDYFFAKLRSVWENRHMVDRSERTFLC